MERLYYCAHCGHMVKIIEDASGAIFQCCSCDKKRRVHKDDLRGCNIVEFPNPKLKSV